MGVYVGLGGDGEPKPYKSWGYDQEGREGYESCSVPPPPPLPPPAHLCPGEAQERVSKPRTLGRQAKGLAS